MRRFIPVLVVFVFLFNLVAAESALWASEPEQTAQGFTLPEAEQARLLKEAQAADELRREAKAKGPTLTIVAEGQPQATIVGSGPAATVLQEWVKLMSGAELPVADQAPEKGPAIYIGDAALAAGLNLDDIQSKSNEGLRIKCDGKNIFIAGQSDGATVRAVGRFLELEFGCRYLSDLDWGKVYPTQDTLKVLVRTITEKPTFRYRRIWGPKGAFKNDIWNQWSGHGGIGTPMSHSWANVVPADSFEKHPEWFRMDENGKRVNGPWYNVGNPEFREKFIEWVVRESDRGNKKLSLSPPDNMRVDYSPEAKKYDEPIDIDASSGRVSMTNRFMGLVNEAAAKVYEMNPDSEFGFYAYGDYTRPPTNPALEHMSPNIAVWIAPIRFSRYHALGHPNSESRMELKWIVDEWAKHASLLGWRTYNYNLAEIMTPYSKITTWAHDLPYLKSKGAYGINFESMNTWELYAPHLYLSIRLAYDPEQNPWAIMADYWHKAYGPAAEPMMRYWMSIDEAFANITSEAGSYHALHLVYTPQRLAHLEKMMAQAESLAAGDEGCAYRVHLARRGLQRAQYWRRWYDAINAGNFDEADTCYTQWWDFVTESIKSGNSNVYAHAYMRRFISPKMRALKKHLYPEDAKPSKIVAVLPDQWKYATQEMLDKMEATGDPFAVGYDDSKWDTVRTFSGTLNEQGYSDYFGPMWYRVTWTAPQELGATQSLFFVKADRKVTVYVDGKQVGDGNVEAFSSAAIDITGALKPGKTSQITIRVDHIPLPELFLGGLVEPIYLVAHPQ